MRFAAAVRMSGHNRQKKDGQRTDKQSSERQQDFEQPILGAEEKQRGQDTSKFTDGEIAGPDSKRKDRSERG